MGPQTALSPSPLKLTISYSSPVGTGTSGRWDGNSRAGPPDCGRSSKEPLRREVGSSIQQTGMGWTVSSTGSRLRFETVRGLETTEIQSDPERSAFHSPAGTASPTWTARTSSPCQSHRVAGPGASAPEGTRTRSGGPLDCAEESPERSSPERRKNETIREKLKSSAHNQGGRGPPVQQERRIPSSTKMHRRRWPHPSQAPPGEASQEQERAVPPWQPHSIGNSPGPSGSRRGAGIG